MIVYGGLRMLPEFDFMRTLQQFRLNCKEYAKMEIARSLCSELSDLSTPLTLDDAWRRVSERYADIAARASDSDSTFNFELSVKIWHWSGSAYLLPRGGGAYAHHGFLDFADKMPQFKRYPGVWEESPEARAERALWELIGYDSIFGSADVAPFLVMPIVSLESWGQFRPQLNGGIEIMLEPRYNFYACVEGPRAKEARIDDFCAPFRERRVL